MACEDCKASKSPETMPYVAHEAAMARNERKEKRMWIIILVLIFSLIGTNAGWLYCESQFEDVTTTTTYESDSSDGGIAVANGDGSVNVNGES